MHCLRVSITKQSVTTCLCSLNIVENETSECCVSWQSNTSVFLYPDKLSNSAIARNYSLSPTYRILKKNYLNAQWSAYINWGSLCKQDKLYITIITLALPHIKVNQTTNLWPILSLISKQHQWHSQQQHMHEVW